MKTSIIVISDFDGTLAAIRRNPKKVRVSKKMRRALEKLKGKAKLIILTGRYNKHWLKKQLPYFAQVLPARGNKQTKKTLQAAKHIKKAILHLKKEFKGIEIENKPIGTVVHYRKAKNINVQKLKKHLGKIALYTNAKILQGRKAIELIPLELNDKAKTVRAIVRNWKGKVMFFGDDDSDAQAAEVVLKKKKNTAFLVETRERNSTPKKAKKLKGIKAVARQLEKIAQDN